MHDAAVFFTALSLLAGCYGPEPDACEWLPCASHRDCTDGVLCIDGFCQAEDSERCLHSGEAGQIPIVARVDVSNNAAVGTVCGTSLCAADAATYCCADSLETSGCQTDPSVCYGSMLFCDGPEDCTTAVGGLNTGATCCFESTGPGTARSYCSTTGCSAAMCHVEEDCPTGTTCRATQDFGTCAVARTGDTARDTARDTDTE